MKQITQFIREHQVNLGSSTLRSYQWQLEQLSLWLEKRSLTFEEMSSELFYDYVVERKWRAGSRYVAFCALRSYIRWQFGPNHPFMKKWIRRGKSSPQRSLDRDQYRQLITHLESGAGELYARDLAMISLMTDSGLRASEVCRLEIQYLDLKEQMCQVIIKGGDWVEAIFGNRTAQHIKTWLNWRDKIVSDLITKGKIDKDPGTVFIAISGHHPGYPLTAQGLRKIFKVLGRRAGVGMLSPHDLRRTFCTLALEAGANTRVVQIVGHWSDVRQVEAYSRNLGIRQARENFPFPTERV